MCLYPVMMRNPKYLPNKKNGGKPPEAPDNKVLWVPVGCGRCEQCMRQRADSWRVRLLEEIKVDKSGVFVTLTFNEDALNDIKTKIDKGKNYQDETDNIAKYAVRHFLERWRKKHGRSVKHWLITELGHTNTERLHLHGLIFTDQKADIDQIWGYGYVYLGQWVNEQTVNYVIKYCTKQDKDHPSWRGKIFCSSGIGKTYRHHDKDKDYYRDRKGFIHGLPHYLKNKIYTEEEKEKLWLDKINDNKAYIGGREYDLNDEKDFQRYYKELQIAINESERKGYIGRKKSD